MTTSIHAGHHVRLELQPWLCIEEVDRLREEDPMTDFFLSVGNTLVRANRSRFECDLNRSRDRCISKDPEDTWGLTIWRDDLPDEQMERSRLLHDEFYRQASARVEALIKEHGRVLVLDLHSFNHLRDGKEGDPAPKPENPDIDLGVTTLDKAIYGDLVERFARRLRSVPLNGETPDVRENKRFPDGGHFPEWLHARYGEDACVMTLEYKKIFMDEWGRSADILALQSLRRGLSLAVGDARQWLEHR
ncbi:N-formylglutamate amidohydrolase [Sphingomicrobium arenosum]|uniref:N-formylglutamate amidohydrolase n=1 Tax=Sphingomicrobium arenosum TaxID=2233861 RepID=UPI00223FDDEA|nr:N-formylglutamate amidohydrolase [Sphingomicrobium arenosum]